MLEDRRTERFSSSLDESFNARTVGGSPVSHNIDRRNHDSTPQSPMQFATGKTRKQLKGKTAKNRRLLDGRTAA
jgi:hypothetical protein